MVFEIILHYLQSISIIILLYLIVFKVINPYLEKRNKNIQYDLYTRLDLGLAEEEINNLIKKYMDDYILKNITLSEIDFIKKPEIEKMIREITKNVTNDLSDVYIFYIKCLTNINDTNDVVSFIFKKVKEEVINYTSVFNQPK